MMFVKLSPKIFEHRHVRRDFIGCKLTDVLKRAFETRHDRSRHGGAVLAWERRGKDVVPEMKSSSIAEPDKKSSRRGSLTGPGSGFGQPHVPLSVTSDDPAGVSPRSTFRELNGT